MYIAPKRKRFNRVKQELYKISILVLAFIGFLFLLNLGIEHLKTLDLSKKVTLNLNNSDSSSVGESFTEERAEVGDVTTLSTVSLGEETVAVDSPIVSLIKKYFPDDLTMIAIARAESGLDPACPSNTDKLSDGRPFSFGLFQINLTVSEIGGVNCSKAFKGKNYNAVVVDEELFEKCVNLAKNPVLNIESAVGKYQSRTNRGLDGRGAWGAYLNKSYLLYI